MAKQVFNAQRKTVFMMDPSDVVIIGIDTDDGPEHPLWDNRIKLEVPVEFVDNVAMEGVLQTIDVAKIGESAVVVNGRQRVRAARVANETLKSLGQELIKVPVMVVQSDEKVTVRKGMSANAHSRPDSPLDQARRIQKLLAHGGTKKEAMVAIGAKTVQTVEDRLRLLELPSHIQDRIDSGEISATQALDALRSGDITPAMAPDKKRKSSKELKPRRVGRPAGPTKPTVQRVIEAGEGRLPSSFMLALRWVCGEISAEEAHVDALLPKKKEKSN